MGQEQQDVGALNTQLRLLEQKHFYERQDLERRISTLEGTIRDLLKSNNDIAISLSGSNLGKLYLVAWCLLLAVAIPTRGQMFIDFAGKLWGH